MHVAMIGTRGVPAAYGGFETAVEEIGRRLVQRGHRVTVYTRPDDRDTAPREYLGMRLVPLPAVHSKALETLTHTGLSVGHVVGQDRPDAAFLFNAANALYLPALRARKIPVATHVDGLEWKRTKWGGGGRRFYRVSESLAVRYSDALIADAAGIADYYQEEFGATTDLIAYGAPILMEKNPALLPAGLAPGEFHLVVARFEPENHVLEAVEGYVDSPARKPLVVVGGAPFAAEYTQKIHAAAGGDERLLFLGPVYDQEALDSLYFHALTYVHGHSVGGTNPSLLRAMGAGTATTAFDVDFNREVLGSDGRYFARPGDIAQHIGESENDVEASMLRGARSRDRAAQRYRWDDVAHQYEALARRLSGGDSQAGRFAGRRIKAKQPAWAPTQP